MSQRVALCVEYDGTNYHGWQTQRGLHHLTTLQDTIETALTKVAGYHCQSSPDLPTSLSNSSPHPSHSCLTNLSHNHRSHCNNGDDESCATNDRIVVCCAGRTDVGVHALGQIVHFDTTCKQRTMRDWVMGANHYLPSDIRVHWARVMPSTFHARFSAITRSYRYVIYNQATNASALWRHRVFWYPLPLDVENMQIAANYLLGEHDFSSFRASSCQSKSANRCIHSITVQQSSKLLMLPSPSSQIITVDITANAFLHHMVRNIVGALISVGVGKKLSSWLLELLAARDRRHAGVTVPSRGLYLLKVEYEHAYEQYLAN